MDKYPCIICENGDPYSNMVCDKCEEHQDFLKELRGTMEQLVRINNDIVGHVPMDISNKITEEVYKIWDQLYNLKIEGKERCH